MRTVSITFFIIYMVMALLTLILGNNALLAIIDFVLGISCLCWRFGLEKEKSWIALLLKWIIWMTTAILSILFTALFIGKILGIMSLYLAFIFAATAIIIPLITVRSSAKHFQPPANNYCII